MRKGVAISMDMRKRAVELSNDGWTAIEVAEVLGIGTASVTRFRALARKGDLTPKKERGRPPTVLSDEDRVVLRTIVEHAPDATLDEIRDELIAQIAGKQPSRATVGREIRRLGFTRKKSRLWPTNS